MFFSNFIFYFYNFSNPMTYYLFLLYCICVVFSLCNLTEDYINLGYQ